MYPEGVEQRNTAHNDGEAPDNVSAEPDPAESRPETSTIRDRHVFTWRHAVRPRPFPGAVYKASRGENQWKHTVVDAEHPGRRARRTVEHRGAAERWPWSRPVPRATHRKPLNVTGDMPS